MKDITGVLQAIWKTYRIPYTFFSMDKEVLYSCRTGIHIKDFQRGFYAKNRADG